MKCVIVATNKGDFQKKEIPLALLEIFGITLLERNLYSLKKMGVDNFSIITGYRTDLIEKVIQEKGLNNKFNLKIIHNKKYDNGIISFNIVREDYNEKDVLFTPVNNLFKHRAKMEKISKRGGMDDLILFQINNEDEIKKSEDILLNHVHTLNISDDFATFYIYEKISKFFTKFFVKTNISPNEITWISFFFEILTAYFFFLGRYGSFVTGAVFLNLFYILDNVDGAIARLKNMSSLHGFWLDALIGFLGQNLWIIGATFGMYNQTKSNLAWIVGIIMVSSMHLKFVKARFNRSALLGDGHVRYVGIPLDANSTGGNLVERLRAYIRKKHLFLGSGNVILIITFGAIFNQMLLAFLLIILIANLQWLTGFILMDRYLKKISENQ